MNYRTIGQHLGASLTEGGIEEESINFAAKKSAGSTTKKSCKKGVPCGNSCIAANRKCKSALDEPEKSLAGKTKTIAPPPSKPATPPKTPTTPSLQPPSKTPKPPKPKGDPSTPEFYIKKGQKFLTKKERELLEHGTDSDGIQAIMAIQTRLKKAHGVSDEDAEKIVKSVRMTKGALDRMPDLPDYLTEFVKLTGYKLDGINTFKYVKNRAHANGKEKSLNVGEAYPATPAERKMRTIFHELGHFIEFQNDDLRKAAGQWIKQKSSESNGGSPLILKLRDLTGYRYPPREVAMVDKFISPYVGKVYSNGDTEVVSMGTQTLSNPIELLKLYRGDRSHFEFLLGAITP